MVNERTNQFRINIIDDRGTISLLAPPHGPKVLAAAAAVSNPESASELLQHAAVLDRTWVETVRIALMQFDEHNTEAVSPSFSDKIANDDPDTHPAFRVLDADTRKRSLVPGSLGLLVFNLRENRIIQIQNAWEALTRRGRGRIRVDGKPTHQLFHYDLPESWSIVP